MQGFVNSISNFDWNETIQTGASLSAVLLAFLALQNWKKQDRAKREAEFLDQLVEASQAFVTSMPRAIDLLKNARIGIVSQAPVYDKDGVPNTEGAIAFITKNSWGIGERLTAALTEAQPFVVRLRSMSDKGQIFGFPKYGSCRSGIVQLTWQYDRIWGFHSVLTNPSLNWEHPEVLSLLEKVIKIDPDDVLAGLSEHHQTIVLFARATSEKLYK